MLQKLKQIGVITPKNCISNKSHKILEEFDGVLLELIEKTKFLYNPTLKSRIYCILKNITTTPLCKKCNNFLRFTNTGYLVYCSRKCQAFVLHTTASKKKRADVWRKKCNGISPWDKKEQKQKREKTLMDRYGTTIPLQNPGIMQRKKDTCQHVYNTEHPWENKDVQEKINITMVTKYGVKSPLQNLSIKKRQQETTRINCIETYGVSHHSQISLIDVLDRLDNKTWLTEQHYIRKRTLTDIANELHVDPTTITCYLHRHGLETQVNYINPGCLYNELYFKRFPEKRNTPAEIYLIKLFNDSEIFIKIGITIHDVKWRYTGFKEYKYEIVLEKCLSLYDAYILEQDIKNNIFKHVTYIPTIKFGGHTECFDIKYINKILTVLRHN